MLIKRRIHRDGLKTPASTFWNSSPRLLKGYFKGITRLTHFMITFSYDDANHDILCIVRQRVISPDTVN